MKKFVSIILSLTFILGMFTVNTFAYTRPENIVSEFNDFENGVGDWTNGVIDGCDLDSKGNQSGNVTESATTLSIASDATGTHGNYLVVNNAGDLSKTATLMFDMSTARKIASASSQSKAEVKTGNYFAFEFDFKLPEDASSTTDLNLMVWDTRVSRSRATLVQITPSSGKVTAGSNSHTISKDTWYKMRLECVVGSALQRFIIMNENGEEIFISNINISKGMPTLLYSFLTFSQGGADCKFYLDNTKAYTFNSSDLNVGRNTATDDFEKYTETASDADRPSGSTNSGSWWYWGDLNNANKHYIALKSEDDDMYARIISDVVGAHSYTDRIAFSIPVKNTADVFGTATVQNPLVIGFKLRVADTELLTDDEIKIGICNSIKGTHNIITSILPKGNAVKVGGASDSASISKGLNLDLGKWHEVRIYQNDTTDYQRVEITNLETNKTQLFEGKCTYDFSDFVSLSFEATCFGKTCVDFDDVVITSMCGDYTQKLCDITGFGVDKAAVEVGNITATVDVKTYSYAEDIVTDTAKLILASYDDTGCLVGLQITDVKPMGGKYTVTLNVPDASYEVKAMLWSASSEGMSTMPLAEHIPLN